MIELTVKDLMERSNEDLYKLALDVKQKLIEDRDTVDIWWDREKDKMFWNKKEPVPLLNFPDLIDSRPFGGRTWEYRRVISDLNSDLKLINTMLINGIKVENINKSNFFDLFKVSIYSTAVSDYILKNILKNNK